MTDNAEDAFCSFIDELLCMLEESLEKEKNKQNREDWTATVKEYQLTVRENIMNTTIVTPEQLEEIHKSYDMLFRVNSQEEADELYSLLNGFSPDATIDTVEVEVTEDPDAPTHGNALVMGIDTATVSNTPAIITVDYSPGVDSLESHKLEEDVRIAQSMRGMVEFNDTDTTEKDRMAKRICRQRKEIRRLYGKLGVAKDAYKYVVEKRDNLSSLLIEERKSITRMEQILDASCDARYKLHEKLCLKEKEVTELKEELCKTKTAYNKYHEEVTNLRDRIAGNLVTVMDILSEGDI